MEFESIQLHWWVGIGNEDLLELAKVTEETLSESNSPLKPIVCALGIYANPLRRDSEGDEARHSIKRLIGCARKFSCADIGLFTGRLPGSPWADSLDEFRLVFGEFCRMAADNGVHLALENCPMGGNDQSGDWNLAYRPEAWLSLFESLPVETSAVIELEWEPAHQMLQGQDPLDQVPRWSDRILHVHGKDAVLQPGGGFLQTLHGNGSTPWDIIFRQLKNTGYSGTVDIEGYHDTEWSGDNEIAGQIHSLQYLKQRRDGRIIGRTWQQPGFKEEKE